MPTYTVQTHYEHKGKRTKYTVNAPNIVALRKRVIKEWKDYREDVSIYAPVKPGKEDANTHYYWENGRKTGVAGRLLGYVDMEYRLPYIVWVTIDYSKGKRGLDAQSEWILRENGTLGKKIR